MGLNIIQESLLYSVYLAPTGYERLLRLGNQIAQRYLNPMDRLVGVIGEAGAGKSLLIKGMFPGMELTNDDNGVNVRPLPLLEGADHSFFNSHTYHVDIRFESAFTQMHVLRDAILDAIKKGKRVVIEHFDLIYPFLNVNAEIIIGVGEQVVVSRPSIYGPLPSEIYKFVWGTGKWRKMAHSAEELTCYILEHDYGIIRPDNYNEILHGFVIEFDEKPLFDIYELENKVIELIKRNVSIDYNDESSILIDGCYNQCTGPRIHMKSAGEIENYYLFKDVIYDSIKEKHTIIGTIGEYGKSKVEQINKIIF